MKNTLLACMILLCSITTLKAQFVNIPDTNFRKFLFAHYPGAMLGNNLDTTHIQIVSATTINCDSLFIRDLSGIQYFDNLQMLNCMNNILKSLPPLPASLHTLWCNINSLDSLPAPLPPNISAIYCHRNRITHLPAFPASLATVNCSYNLIDTLPAIPQFAQYFNCSNNKIDSLPTLPSSLIYLDYSSNLIANNQVLPLGLQTLNCSNNPLYSLPVLNPSLTSLMCNSNILSALPNLPANLQLLHCNFNLLPVLPALPSSIQHLECTNNVLPLLPVLPSSLQTLICAYNQLPTLPVLPMGLQTLNCSYNVIPTLPLLPVSLQTLDYSSNPIATLPLLPVNLKKLVWNYNNTNILPNLPLSLTHLYASYNVFDSLPAIPAGLKLLECAADSLTFLPMLPNTLQYLNFSVNQLDTMPVMYSGLQTLLFASNLIDTFITMPLTVNTLNCSGNTNISCLPKIPSTMNAVQLSNTAVTCLPNYFFIVDTAATSPAVFSLPLCTPAGNCLCAWNITGNAHVNNGANCALDSLTPGSRVKNVRMLLYQNNILLENVTVTMNGEYSFDTAPVGNFEVVMDTSDTPLKIVCPVASFHQVSLSLADSMKPNTNFAVECSGIDAGVKSIMGRFRPAIISHLNINAGDLAQFFNVDCNSVNPGTVTTVIQGPVSYLQPSANALTPTLINGNLLQYNVADLSAIDYATAFDVEVSTDMSATIGDQVCVHTTVSNVANDMQVLNDELEVCFPVVNSFDPNAKYVYPASNSKPGDMLTYTIQFQNTGNDTAYQVIIRDTLSDNLDWNSFVLKGSSHINQVTQNGKYLAFNFYKINLLDSVSNEPESHGWLQYTIKLKSDLKPGAKTLNRASIYFDFNSPILTNVATNFVGRDTTYEGGADPFMVPNAISPNGDGRNDSWSLLNTSFIERKKIQANTVQIFNRWGQKVYSSTGSDFLWNPAPTDASDNYTYIISYRTYSGNEWIQKGTILLVR